MSFIAGVANAPRSWGVLEFDLEGEYYVQVLDEMAEAGYAGTELGDGGVIPTDSAVLLLCRSPTSTPRLMRWRARWTTSDLTVSRF